MKPLQTHNTVDKGTVLPGFGKLKPIPIPKHTRDLIVTVLSIPMSYLIANWWALVVCYCRWRSIKDSHFWKCLPPLIYITAIHITQHIFKNSQPPIISHY